MKRLTARNAARRSACMPVFGAIALLLAHVCQAQTATTRVSPAETSPPAGSVWLAASDQTLDRLRGGFNLGAGLVVSFGIQRSVSINGQLITSTSFQLGELTSLTSPQAAALGQHLAAQTQVVSNGKGNTLESGTVTVPFGTYIQNTLNNQTLSSQTVIDATSNGMGIVKGMNLQVTISEAIAQALATR